MLGYPETLWSRGSDPCLLIEVPDKAAFPLSPSQDREFDMAVDLPLAGPPRQEPTPGRIESAETASPRVIVAPDTGTSVEDMEDHVPDPTLGCGSSFPAKLDVPRNKVQGHVSIMEGILASVARVAKSLASKIQSADGAMRLTSGSDAMHNVASQTDEFDTSPRDQGVLFDRAAKVTSDSAVQPAAAEQVHSQSAIDRRNCWEAAVHKERQDAEPVKLRGGESIASDMEFNERRSSVCLKKWQPLQGPLLLTVSEMLKSE